MEAIRIFWMVFQPFLYNAAPLGKAIDIRCDAEHVQKF
jgi:hypothetical protein